MTPTDGSGVEKISLAAIHAANELSIKGALHDAFRTIKGHETVAKTIDYYLIAERAELTQSKQREADSLNREEALAQALRAAKEYHEYVRKECIWHLEANAQIGLSRLLEIITTALANHDAAKAKDAARK